MTENKADIQKLIRTVFPRIATEGDLLQLLNSINQKLHYDFYAAQDKEVPVIKLSTFKYYKNYSVSRGKRYRHFTIKKKSGKNRIIHSPARGLKVIQQCLNEIFQTYYEPNEHACGFVPERSIVDGARLHTDKPYVLNIDLKDFFDTIVFPRVKKVLTLPPFNLSKEKEQLAYIITSLCCHPKKESKDKSSAEDDKKPSQCLPQGAPTSPILTNIVCRNLDRHLAGLARRFKASYSRYADDITFSCHKNIFKQDSEFVCELKRIIEEEQGLKINTEKTRLQTKRQRQEVTGLVVNKKVNVSQRYVKQLRLWLHYWERFGIERAQDYFIQQYIRQRGNVKNHKARIENVIDGKLNYMLMIVGNNNPAYVKLKQRYDKLVENTPIQPMLHSKIAPNNADGISNKEPLFPPEIIDEPLDALLDSLIEELK